MLCQCEVTVQGGIPMTVQGESGASSPCKRPKARRPLAKDHGFILPISIPAGGFRTIHPNTGGRP